MDYVKITSKKKTISSKAKYITDMSEQSIGLMFFKRGEILMDLARESRSFAAIHTWLCRQMDIVWLDKKKTVVDFVHAKPWRMFMPRKPAQYVFETTEKDLDVKIGDKFSFKKV
jgi:uncharacterized membrane protein (UPF0127 family)